MGTLRYRIGDETIEGSAGSSFYVPDGTLENFEPIDTARILVIYPPGGAIDRFFSEVGEPARVREVPPPPESPPDFQSVAAVAERYGIQMQAAAER